jgi:hypothetical protein
MSDWQEKAPDPPVLPPLKGPELAQILSDCRNRASLLVGFPVTLSFTQSCVHVFLSLKIQHVT